MPMLLFAAVGCLAGLIQSVTGFGAGVTMVLFMSGYYTMVAASSINTSMCLGLTLVMAWKYRKHLNYRLIIFPTIVYALVSTFIINVVDRINMDVLTIVFGIFLMALSVFYLFFSNKIHVKANLPTALGCSMASGLFSGLFSIGGPVMALYLVSVSNDHEEYLANTQFLFLIINIVNLTVRTIKGLYTFEYLPLSIVGIVAINVGALAGSWVYHRLNADVMKKIVYVFVGISGAVTLIQQLF